MFLKKWPVIIILGCVGSGLLYYWLTAERVPPGVTPQSGQSDTITLIVSLAGAIGTLGGAVSGLVSKYYEFRKTQLEIEAQELEILQKRKELEKE